ncbi:TOBE domain-containing protein [Streptomyces spongiae]|uniref:Mop domain-containing protein n=1 Tax=Streptomyces spongiae TaxID=565072 RepID=A0A5N8XGQ2_9ACTN|nr:hypothetical protein [Streptomyces spongiae]
MTFISFGGSDSPAAAAVKAAVKAVVAGGELTAAITAESVADLGLADGSSVTALIKSTEVSLAAG